MKSFRPVALLVLAVLLPSMAEAVQRPREHEGGILIRLSAGAGAASAQATDDQDKWEFNEGSFNSNFALGGIVTENLALHATFMGFAVSDPKLEYNGNNLGELDGTVFLRSLGGGVTWYIMPVNIYISGSLGFAWMSWKDDNVTLDSAVGGAIDLTVGKEWWVSDRWGLGVALGLQGYNIPIDNADGEFEGGAVAVRFSATFN